MKPEQQRLALLEWAGWKYWHDNTETLLLPPDSKWPSYPHWKERGIVEGDGRPNSPLIEVSMLEKLNSLDCLAEFEAKLSDEQWDAYSKHLVPNWKDWVGTDKGVPAWKKLIHAKSAQKLEALVRTLGLWREGE